MYRNAVLCYNDARLTGGIGVRLNKVKSKNTVSYYIIRSVRRNGKNSSEIVKKLGTGQFIRETYHVDDPDGWAREQLRRMNVVTTLIAITKGNGKERDKFWTSAIRSSAFAVGERVALVQMFFHRLSSR